MLGHDKECYSIPAHICCFFICVIYDKHICVPEHISVPHFFYEKKCEKIYIGGKFLCCVPYAQIFMSDFVLFLNSDFSVAVETMERLLFWEGTWVRVQAVLQSYLQR